MAFKIGKYSALFIMVVCTLFTASAQILLKKGVSTLDFNFFSIVTNYYLIIGIVFYTIATVLLLLALHKSQLSIAFPLVTLGYVWAILLSYTFLNESITLGKIIGIVFICSGAILLNGSAHK